jgi:hypothetical protein
MALGANVPVVIRLTQADLALLDALALELHAARPGTVALALRHLAESMDRGQPVYPRHQPRGPGAGLAAINTPPPGLRVPVGGQAARMRERLRDRQRGR